jgi:hypothetical protein
MALTDLVGGKMCFVCRSCYTLKGVYPKSLFSSLAKKYTIQGIPVAYYKYNIAVNNEMVCLHNR